MRVRSSQYPLLLAIIIIIIIIMSRHFMQSHIRRVHACLAVTRHLRVWQNDRGLLRAAALTRGWNRYQNNSQHRKLTPEKKFSRRSCRDSNPRPFDDESGALTTEVSPHLRTWLQKVGSAGDVNLSTCCNLSLPPPPPPLVSSPPPPQPLH